MSTILNVYARVASFSNFQVSQDTSRLSLLFAMFNCRVIFHMLYINMGPQSWLVLSKKPRHGIQNPSITWNFFPVSLHASLNIEFHWCFTPCNTLFHFSFDKIQSPSCEWACVRNNEYVTTKWLIVRKSNNESQKHEK